MEEVQAVNPDELVDKTDYSILYPKDKKNGIYRRYPSNIVLFIILIGILASAVRTVLSYTQYPLLLLGILLFIIFIRKESIDGTYRINDDGLSVPYSWLTRKQIPLKNILDAYMTRIRDAINKDIDYDGLQFELDTPLVKYNTTGMHTPNIILTTQRYDIDDLNHFLEQVKHYLDKITVAPDTLAERLRKQVNIAWRSRWKLFVLNTFDMIIEFIFYIMIIELVLRSIFKYSLFPIIGTVLIIITFLLAIFVQYMNLPAAIVGIRPNELEPLVYLENDTLTNVKFMVMSYPNTIVIKDVKLKLPETAMKQIMRVIQIQPKNISPGELTHVVAQVLGNHTRATGAIVQFEYKGKDQLYEVEISWAG